MGKKVRTADNIDQTIFFKNPKQQLLIGFHIFLMRNFLKVILGKKKGQTFERK